MIQHYCRDLLQSSVSHEILSKPEKGKLVNSIISTTLCLQTCFEAAVGGRIYFYYYYLLTKSKNLILNFGHSNKSVLKRSIVGSAVVLVLVTWVIKCFPTTSWQNHLTYELLKLSQYSISLSPMWKTLLQEKNHIIKTESFTLEDHQPFYTALPGSPLDEEFLKHFELLTLICTL